MISEIIDVREGDIALVHECPFDEVRRPGVEIDDKVDGFTEFMPAVGVVVASAIDVHFRMCQACAER